MYLSFAIAALLGARSDLALAHEIIDNGPSKITGTVRNYSSADYSFVSISLKVYDSSGAIVGNAYDNVSGIGPYETWRFEAYLPRGGIKFKVENITAVH